MKFKHIIIFLCGFYFPKLQGQNFNKSICYAKILSVQGNTKLSDSEKLAKFYFQKQQFENNHTIDSCYAQILFFIGQTEPLVSHSYINSISLITEALKINTHSREGNKINSILNSLYIASYYEYLNMYSKALCYYDTTLLLSLKFSSGNYNLFCNLHKSFIYFKQGDYQRCIEESSNGISYAVQIHDSNYYPSLLNQRSQAFLLENKLQLALSDVKLVCNKKTLISLYDYASALKTEAGIFVKNNDLHSADSLFKKSIEVRKSTKNINQISRDYVAYGNFYLNSLKNYSAAIKLYTKAVQYAGLVKDNETLSGAYTDIGEAFLEEKKYDSADKYYNYAFSFLNIDGEKFTAAQVNLVGYKDLIISLLKDKTELFLARYHQNNKEDYLNKCIKTARITDSVITETRQEQTGEQSKLYWRNKTRDFFANVLEACYLAKDASTAFYFMEKSKAVLLNDKLNELGASELLPADKSMQEENFQTKITGEEQSLALLKENSNQYILMQAKLFTLRESFENFTKTLERNYPQYYQYKYADNIITLTRLQQYLESYHQSFIHYFIGDSVSYMLGITSSTTKFIKISSANLSSKTFNDFVQTCSDKQLLNNHYDSFAIQSNQLFQRIFRPLQIPKGRVIICPDNFFIPFEALCYDKAGKSFLVNDYAFSYVYSARYLMNNCSIKNAGKIFLGIAPVNFSAKLNLPDLVQSDEALHNSAKHYHSSKLMTNEDASHKNFMKFAGDFAVVNIFSHARADSTNEPCLFMQDSVIYLSELQLLNHPSTQLIVLSACQTNVGKNATGEGIYSLARGFAAAGVPSVAATLWKADDEMIYSISEKFHEYLSEGMPKDVALQKAKLYFMKNNTEEKLLPFFWANMVLAGNAEPLRLSAGKENLWWLVAACFILASIIFLMLRKRRKNVWRLFNNR